MASCIAFAVIGHIDFGELHNSPVIKTGFVSKMMTIPCKVIELIDINSVFFI